MKLLCFGILVVICYGIYMTVGPGGDGVIFGSVMGVLCALAGVKLERFRAKHYITPVSTEHLE